MTRRGFVNAHFLNQTKTAVLVDEGHFICFGDDKQIEKLTGFDELVDLGGMYVYPGFVDSHMHLAEFGMYMNQVQLKTCRDLDEIAAALKTAQLAKQESEWIIGRGWIEHQPDAVPDRAFLDAACGSHPTALMRADGHMMTVNTAAFNQAGIHEDRDIEGGHIDYTRGFVTENAIRLIAASEPQPNAETIRKYIMDGAKEANRYGVTSVGSDDFLSVIQDWRPVLNEFEKLSYQEKLTVRVNEQCEFATPEEFAAFLDEGYTFDVGNDFFRIGPLKLVTDGSLGARTAYLTRPYLNDGNNQGTMIMDEETIETFIKLAHHFNMPVIAHAIGDGAVDIMLDMFKENTFDIFHANPLHDGLVHCQILRKDQIEKIRQYQLSCYIQSVFIKEDASLLDNINPALRSYSYPFKTLFENNLTSNGSDAPVELPDVIQGMIYAETRKDNAGKPLNTDQALSRRQALASYTEKGYEQLFMSQSAGNFKEGNLADFVVADRDILHCSIEELKQAKIMMTVMNGNPVYEK